MRGMRERGLFINNTNVDYSWSTRNIRRNIREICFLEYIQISIETIYIYATKSINDGTHPSSISNSSLRISSKSDRNDSRNACSKNYRKEGETRFIKFYFTLTMKANPIVLHEQSNSFGHGNKGREGERLVKNHGPFHLLTPVNGGTPWIRWHRGEEKHDRESNYKLEEFNLIEGVRALPPTLKRSFTKLGQRAARLQWGRCRFEMSTFR